MIEIRTIYTDEEIIEQLRSLGATVEMRTEIRQSQNETWPAEVLKVKTATGTWTDAAEIFRTLTELALKRSVSINLNKLDLLNLIKK